jgi:hypothetical protein
LALARQEGGARSTDTHFHARSMGQMHRHHAAWQCVKRQCRLGSWTALALPIQSEPRLTRDCRSATRSSRGISRSCCRGAIGASPAVLRVEPADAWFEDPPDSGRRAAAASLATPAADRTAAPASAVKRRRRAPMDRPAVRALRLFRSFGRDRGHPDRPSSSPAGMIAASSTSTRSLCDNPTASHRAFNSRSICPSDAWSLIAGFRRRAWERSGPPSAAILS